MQSVPELDRKREIFAAKFRHATRHSVRRERSAQSCVRVISVAIPSTRRVTDWTLIGCTVTALHRVAWGTAVPGTPSTSTGTSIRRAIAALDGVTRWAAVPGSPAVADVSGWSCFPLLVFRLFSLSSRRPTQRQCGVGALRRSIRAVEHLRKRAAISFSAAESPAKKLAV